MTIGYISADTFRLGDEQPKVDNVAGVALVADCRLDNRRALSRELCLPPTSRDADLLMAAFRKWGRDMGRELEGDFSVVVWDQKRQQVLLIRDHFGVKPLYYLRRGANVVVASDLALLHDIARPHVVADDQLVVEHLLMNYRSRDRTFWSAIKRVPSGHTISIDCRGEVARQYWEPPPGEIENRSTAEVHEAARALFLESVAQRLESDGPVVAHLSGGIDSTSIVAAARALSSDGVHRPQLTLAGATYPGLACDESPFIKAAAAETKFPLHLWDARLEGIRPLIRPSLVGPGMGDHEVGDMMLARSLRARVLISGQGGDFLLSCDGVQEDVIAQRSVIEAAKRVLGSGIPLKLRTVRLRNLVRRSVPVSIRSRVGYWRARWRAPAWLQSQWHQAAASLVQATYNLDVGEGTSFVKARHWQSMQSASLAMTLEMEQQRAAEQGVEMRYPFLSLPLAKYVMRIPFNHWPEVAPYSRLHREFMSRDLPEIVRTRTKTTFSEGVAFRLRHAWPTIRTLLFSGEWLSERYVNRAAAQALARRAAGDVGHEWAVWRPLWGIATLEAWLRRISMYPTRGDRSQHECQA